MGIRIRVVTLLLTAVLLGVAACSSTYYVVKDPKSGNEYYTTDLKRSNGKVSFKDAKTLAEVTLQDSEIQEITSDQFKAKTGVR